MIPDPGEEHLAGEHLAGSSHQLDQQTELRRGEREIPPVLPRGVADDIDLEITHTKDGLGGLGRRPAKDRPTARHEHRHVERLRHVVVGAELQADDDVGRIGTSGQHHDRDAAVFADLARDLEPVERRQHHIEHREVERITPEAVEPLSPVGAGGHSEPGVGEPEHRHLADRGVVFDQQHLFVHGRSVARSGRQLFYVALRQGDRQTIETAGHPAFRRQQAPLVLRRPHGAIQR